MRRTKSLNTVNERLAQLSLCLIDDSFTAVQVKTRFPEYKVKCLKCGRQYHTQLRRNHVKECICSDRLFRISSELNLSIVERGDDYHTVQCNVCSSIYNTRLWREHGLARAKACDKCKRNNRIKYHEDKHNITIYGEIGRGIQTQVMCNVCKTKFFTDVTSYSSYCPGCVVVEQSKLILPMCEEGNVTFNDIFKGIYLGKGKGYRYYNVVCKTCNTEYETCFNSSQGINLCPQCKQSLYRSKRELEISLWLSDLGVVHYNSYKHRTLKFNKPFEIDIYIPSHRIGFEFNGSYYHSSAKISDKEYHKRKTEVALDNDIRLYHIWNNVPIDLVKSIILSKLGMTSRVYARTLSICKTPDTKEFFDSNHIQGNTRAHTKYALVKDGDIYAALSIRTTNGIQEIARFATKQGITVVGGYSRLLKHIITDLQITTLISYCNRDLSPDPHNTFYSKYGFKYIGDSGPMLKYHASVEIPELGVVRGLNNRQLVQRHKLLQYNPNLTGTGEEMANALGMWSCYNSGNFKYILKC